MRYRKTIIVLGVFMASLVFSSFSLAASGPWKFVMQMPARDAEMKTEGPMSLALDAAGRRYYVVDVTGGKLVSFDETGKLLAGFNAGGQIKKPVAMVRNSRGKLWVIERSTNELLFVNPKQKEVRRFGLTYADDSLIFPARLGVDGQDRLYVLDRMKGGILRLDDNLKVEKTFAGGEGFRGFSDFKLKADGIWALDGLSHKVYHFDGNGNLVDTVSLEAGLQFPVALEVDAAGQLYILDRHAGRIAVFSPGGHFKFDFLDKGKRQGRLWYPTDLRFDWQGRLFVVDEGNHRIDVFSR